MGFDPLGWMEVSKKEYDGLEITRDDLKQVIEGGIRAAKYDSSNPTLAANLRRVGEVNEWIFIGGWGATTDIPGLPTCGCPLTEAGLVKIDPGNPNNLRRIGGPGNAHGHFYGHFDSAASSRARPRGRTPGYGASRTGLAKVV
jgi:hypothetical protein